MNQALNELRHRIDEIDLKLLDLLNQRGLCALEIAAVKRQLNMTKFYCPEREREVLKKIVGHNVGPLDDAAIHQVFRQIMSLCLSLQQPLTVACLGPAGTYSEEAAYQHLGDFIELSLKSSFKEVIEVLLSEDVKLAVIPLYNSTAGLVRPALDQLLKADVSISAELVLPIRHNLLVNEKTQEIHVIYAHEQSLKQCQKWLEQHQAGIRCIAVASNGEAAARAQQEVGAAAIASARCAEKLGLTIRHKHIMDKADNSTRFVVVNKGKATIRSDQSIAYLWLDSDEGLDELKRWADFDLKAIDLWQSSQGVLVRLSVQAGHVNLARTVIEVQECVRSCRILGYA